MTFPGFSLQRFTRLLVVVLELLFVVGMIATLYGGRRFMVAERPEARFYAAASGVTFLAFLLLVTVEAWGVFSPSLRRFALFGLGRLLIYLIVLCLSVTRIP